MCIARIKQVIDEVIMLLLAFLLFVQSSYGDTDPCVSKHWLEDDGGRSSNCDLQYEGCDRYIKQTWYQVTTEVNFNLNMPRSCVGVLQCGTTYPIWMNGSLPTASEGIANRTVCVSTPDSCCDHSYNIMVKNCTYFYVYYLIRTDGCKERYCFGDSNQCPTTTTTTTTTTTITESVNKPTSPIRFITTISSQILSNTTMNPVTFVLLVLSMCLMGTTVGLATFIFLRHRRQRRIDMGPTRKSPPPPYSMSHE